MSAGTIVAETGAALRSSLAVWLASGGSGVPGGAAVVADPGDANGTDPGLRGGSPAALLMTLMRVATSPLLRNGPGPQAVGDVLQKPSILDGLEVEYVVWPVAARAVEAERLIGAALEWLVRTPVLKVEAGGVTCKVAITASDLSREEVARLWTVTGTGALLAFSAQVTHE
jgi:hypothetical protein